MKNKTLPTNKKVQEKVASIVKEATHGEDLEHSLPNDAYLFHGTDESCLQSDYEEDGILLDKQLRVSKSIDQENGIFFTSTLDDAEVYGRWIVAIPIKALSNCTILKNENGNKQEQSTLMIKDDVPLPDTTLIYHYSHGWMGINEAEHKLNDGFGEPLPDKEVQKLLTALNNQED